MAAKGFPATIDLVKLFENKKPPVVPYYMQILADDLVQRSASNVISLTPYTCKSLLAHSKHMIENDKARLQTFLSNLMSEKKPPDTGKDIMRLKLTGKFTTTTVLSGLIEFFNRCDEGFYVTLTYPVDAWIIIGCATKEFQDDDTRFTREFDAFIREYAEDFGIQKDFCCFLFQMFTNLLQICVETNKRNRIIPGIIVFILSRFFGPKVIRVKCDYCHNFISTIKEIHCDRCKEVLVRIRFPAPVMVMLNILTHVPLAFWNNAISNPRPGVMIKRNGDIIRKEMLMSIRMTKDSHRLAQAPIQLSDSKLQPETMLQQRNSKLYYYSDQAENKRNTSILSTKLQISSALKPSSSKHPTPTLKQNDTVITRYSDNDVTTTQRKMLKKPKSRRGGGGGNKKNNHKDEKDSEKQNKSPPTRSGGHKSKNGKKHKTSKSDNSDWRRIRKNIR